MASAPSALVCATMESIRSTDIQGSHTCISARIARRSRKPGVQPGGVSAYDVTFCRNVSATATAEVDGETRIITAGGRVLNLTGLGPDPAAARQRAYDAAEAISFNGKQMRTDIANRAVERAGQEEKID